MHFPEHLFLSWLIPWRSRLERRDRFLVCVAGLAPDVDAVSALWGAEAFEKWHHTYTHHVAGAALAAAAGFALAKRRGATAAFMAAAWLGHLVCDMAGAGERREDGTSVFPLPLLWPFSDRPFEVFPFAWPLASWQNAVVMVAAIALVLRLAVLEGRTVVEVFSPRADAAVVAAVRRRFPPTRA